MIRREIMNRWGWCFGLLMAGLLVGCGGGDAEDEAAAAERERAELIAEVRKQVKAELAEESRQTKELPPAAPPTTPAAAPTAIAATASTKPAPAASAPATNAPPTAAPTATSTPISGAAEPASASKSESEGKATSEGGGASGNSGNSGGGGGPIAFRAHAIQDQTGMHAASILVPRGWDIQANVIRQPPHLPRTFAMTDILVSAPDGREFHLYPSFSFVYSNTMQAQPLQPVDGGLFLPPPESIGQWLLQMYQLEPDPTITNLRIASEEEYAPLTQQLRQLAAPTFQSMQQLQANSQPGDQLGFDTQGTKIVFRYEKDGEPKEETFIAGWQIMVFQYGQLGMTTAQWGVYNMRSVSGPVGTDYMNDPALVTIAQSFKTTPQWDEAMAQFYRAIAPKPNPRQPTPTTTTTSVGQTNSDVLDIMHKGWQDRQAIRDGGQASNVNMIHERTAYADPNAVGGTVNLSSHYNHVLTDGQNNYLLHNDANWNANTDPNFNNQNWQTLTPQQ